MTTYDYLYKTEEGDLIRIDRDLIMGALLIEESTGMWRRRVKFRLQIALKYKQGGADSYKIDLSVSSKEEGKRELERLHTWLTE